MLPDVPQPGGEVVEDVPACDVVDEESLRSRDVEQEKLGKNKNECMAH